LKHCNKMGGATSKEWDVATPILLQTCSVLSFTAAATSLLQLLVAGTISFMFYCSCDIGLSIQGNIHLTYTDTVSVKKILQYSIYNFTKLTYFKNSFTGTLS